MSPPLVAGVDLSLTSTGIALSTGLLRRITSKGAAGDGLNERSARLSSLADQVVLAVADAELVVIEGPSYASQGGSAHDRSGLWWLVVANLRDRGVDVVEVTPNGRAKYATGTGTAAKGKVLAAVVRRFAGWDVDDDDVADALVLCAMGADAAGHPLVEMPAAHRAALRAVAWPLWAVAS